MDIVHRKTLQHFNLPGQAHELTFSCYRGLPLLSRDRACRWLIEAIDNTRKKQDYSVFAFVIMPEHVHIIVYPRNQTHDIAWFLKSVKQSVSRKAHKWLSANNREWLEKLTFIEKGQAVFRFWQAGGCYDRNIVGYAALMKMIEYIHANPVRRGLVDTAGDWPWSSASWYEKHEGVLEIDPML